MANRYVDNSLVPVGDGLSWATAWHGFDHITGLSSGDILYISGGITSKTYPQELIVSTAGVTVRPGAAEPSPNPNHSGTVIITGIPDHGIWVSANNVTINGNDGVGNRKIRVSNTSQGIVIAQGLTVGVHIDYIDINGVTWRGIVVDHSWGVDIGYCHIHNMGLTCDQGIQVFYTWDRWADMCTIHHCIIEVPVMNNWSGNGSDGINSSCCTTVYNCEIRGIGVPNYAGTEHPDGWQSQGSWTKGWNNIVESFANWGFGWLLCDEVCYAFNNYFYNTQFALYSGDRDGSLRGNKNDIRFENNTIVDCIPGTVGSQIVVQPGCTACPCEPNCYATNVFIRNNIVINCTNPIRVDVGDYECGTDVVIDYNITVAGARGNATVRCQNVEYQEPTYHSHTLPTFVNYVPDAGDSNDMRLAGTDNIARNHGLDLSSDFELVMETPIDMNGVVRPQQSVWDIGAYEYAEEGEGSVSPSKSPSLSPSASKSPSRSPSLSPSASKSPSRSPSVSPSLSPSASRSPSRSPSPSPSVSPSVSPSLGQDIIRFVMVDSPHIVTDGENTTGQLYAPLYKTTDFFKTGRIYDDHNPTLHEIDLTSTLGNELSINGDMELDSNWESVNLPETNERSGVRKHGGTYSRRVVDSNASWGGIRNTAFTSTTGRMYRMGFWYYIDSGTHPNGVLRLVWTRGSDGTGINLASYSTRDVWTYEYYDHTETAGGANAAVTFINNSNAVAAEFYIDDVSVKEVINKYTEIEWCIKATDDAEVGATYEFRVTKGT